MATYADWLEDVGIAYRGGEPSASEILLCIKDGVRGIMARDIESDLPLAKSYRDSFDRALVKLAGARSADDAATIKASIRALMPVDDDTDAMGGALDNAILACQEQLNGMADQYERFVQEAAIELQRHVPFYQVRQLATYTHDTAGISNTAFYSAVALPEGARVANVWHGEYHPALAEGEELEDGDIVVSNGRLYIVVTGGTLAAYELGDGLTSTDGEDEELGDLTFQYYEPARDYPARFLPWARRHEMVAGRLSAGPFWTMPPEADEVWFYPVLTEGYRFDLDYVAVAQDFQGTDTVTFDRVAAKGAAQYVRGIFAQDSGDLRGAQAALAIFQRAIREAIVDNQDRQVGSEVQVVPYDWSRRPRICGTPTACTTAYPNDWMARVNTTGDISLTSRAANQVIDLTVGGDARTSLMILETAGRAAGDRMIVVMVLPTTADIVFEPRNGTSSGTLLLPSEVFPDQQFTTDGLTTSALLEFTFDGTAWQYASWKSPA